MTTELTMEQVRSWPIEKLIEVDQLLVNAATAGLEKYPDSEISQALRLMITNTQAEIDGVIADLKSRSQTASTGVEAMAREHLGADNVVQGNFRSSQPTSETEF
jgi:hypothetical protein